MIDSANFQNFLLTREKSSLECFDKLASQKTNADLVPDTNSRVNFTFWHFALLTLVASENKDIV